MHTFRCLPLLFLVVIACQKPENYTQRSHSAENACIISTIDDSTNAASYQTVRGALLGTRFNSLEALKSVIRIEYGNGAITSDSAAPENRIVRVHHCSSGKEVVSVLEKGIGEGDFIKAFNAKRSGAFWKNFSLLYRCPYAVMNRDDLGKIHALLRRKPEWFGANDLAFFDIATSSVAHINTPEIAFRNPRDSTEKGYLNSFNHITAQVFITTCFSEEMADFIADTHERYRHPELITGIFTEKQLNDLEEGPVDNYVDIVNNEWGQELGKQLKQKYNITRETNWTPELMANYLNDLLSYYSWAFQIGFEPYNPRDEAVIRFSGKLDAVMKGRFTIK